MNLLHTVVTGLCDLNNSRARHHCSLKLGSKLKHLNVVTWCYKNCMIINLDKCTYLYLGKNDNNGDTLRFNEFGLVNIRDHPFSTYTKFSEKLAFRIS